MRIKYIAVSFLLIYACATDSAQGQSLQQLMQEFTRIGIYNPQAPNMYNEQRAQAILEEIRKTSEPRARQLELAQRQSLDLRPTAPTVPTRAPAPTELQRLQDENQRLTTALNQVKTIAFELISSTNDLMIHVANAAHELTDNNNSAAAQTSLTNARTRMNTIDDIRNRLEATTFPAP